MKLIIDIDDNVFTRLFDNGVDTSSDDRKVIDRAIRNGMPYGECKSCRHRDPEDKKCDCGGLERQGCPFPVSDDYFCKFYEKGDAE